MSQLSRVLKQKEGMQWCAKIPDAVRGPHTAKRNKAGAYFSPMSVEFIGP